MAQIRGTFTIFGDVGHGRPTAAGSPVAGTAAKNLHSPRSLGAAGRQLPVALRVLHATEHQTGRIV